jgi:hypothetical protein
VLWRCPESPECPRVAGNADHAYGDGRCRTHKADYVRVDDGEE